MARVLSFLAVFSLPTLSLALPFPPPAPLSPRTDPKHPNWGCSFPGNSDLYGLGIRLGVYLQLLATVLANSFLPDSIREDAQNTNSIIMIAVFAGMATATLQGNMNAVEIFVMSMLLSAFLFSDFTPAHISAIVLFEDGAEGKMQCQRRIPRDKLDLSEEERTERDGKKRYFAAIARSLFGTASAVFTFWYWFDGRHRFLKNGIVGQPNCEPTLFLNTQIVLDGYQPMAYIVIAVLNAVWEVVFMVWWVVILAPGTFRLLSDVVSISVIAIVTGRLRRFREIRVKVARWYISFARLDPRTLKMFERFRMSKKTEYRFKRCRYLLTWFGPPTGYSVIIWATLATEMTLAWNNVSGIYNLRSTGQLIPFVVGVLSLLRIMHLILVQISDRASQKRERDIMVKLGDGKFVYEFGKEKELILNASRPERRRSIDSGAYVNQVSGKNGPWGSQAESLRSLTWKSEG